MISRDFTKREAWTMLGLVAVIVVLLYLIR